MTTWVRVRGGKAIHRPECHQVKKALRVSTWPWADGIETDMDLLAKLGDDWNSTWNWFCYFCCSQAHYEQKQRLRMAEAARHPTMM